MYSLMMSGGCTGCESLTAVAELDDADADADP